MLKFMQVRTFLGVVSKFFALFKVALCEGLLYFLKMMGSFQDAGANLFHKGTFKNYVDHFLPYFDHLPTSSYPVY